MLASLSLLCEVMSWASCAKIRRPVMASQQSHEIDKEKGTDSVYVQMYFEHQYNWMKKLENEALTITSLVIALTAAILTYGFSDGKVLAPTTAIGISILMAVINLFAIAYTIRVDFFYHVHQRRAKEVLKIYSPNLYKLDRSIAQNPPGDRFWRRRNIHLALHFVLILVSFLPLVLYLQNVAKSS